MPSDRFLCAIPFFPSRFSIMKPGAERIPFRSVGHHASNGNHSEVYFAQQAVQNAALGELPIMGLAIG